MQITMAQFAKAMRNPRRWLCIPVIVLVLFLAALLDLAEMAVRVFSKWVYALDRALDCLKDWVNAGDEK